MSTPRELERADYDGTWKQVIEELFEEFLDFFFPAARALLDWQRPPESLDTELQQVFPDSETGKRQADKLFKAWLADGREVWILVHIEVQSQEDSAFSERMYIYHYRLFDRYRRPVVSLAVLGDENPRWRPQAYAMELGGCSLRLEFPTVKLLDYDDATLQASRNPLALVVMAHLRAKDTTGRARARQASKLQLARELFSRGYSREDIIHLLRALDGLLALPATLQAEFETELRAMREEVQMPVLMELEWRALERGREEGREEGRAEGREEGREEGAQAELVAAIAEVLAVRFEADWLALGDAEQGALRDRLRSLALDQLQPLHRQALLAPALADFVAALPGLEPDSEPPAEPEISEETNGRTAVEPEPT